LEVEEGEVAVEGRWWVLVGLIGRGETRQLTEVQIAVNLAAHVARS
jgi:hypothetical protein